MPNLDPLAGQYEPGQAFTMVSAAMFLAGGLTPNTILPCPASNSVNGHTFYNQPAEPPLRADHAIRQGLRHRLLDGAGRSVAEDDRRRSGQGRR